MDEIEKYLRAALQKDTKLCKFIENTLNNGPDTDEDEINKQNMSSMPSTSLDETLVGTSSTNHSRVEMNQSMDEHLGNVSSFEANVSENDPELTYYFAEPNDFERDCASAHVKRLKRELQESAKRKQERREQPKQRQFTGKPIAVGNISKKPKRRLVRSRQCKKPSSAAAGKSDKA